MRPKKRIVIYGGTDLPPKAAAEGRRFALVLKTDAIIAFKGKTHTATVLELALKEKNLPCQSPSLAAILIGTGRNTGRSSRVDSRTLRRFSMSLNQLHWIISTSPL